MPNDNVKEQLIQATIKLLKESNSPGKITARQIAAEAEVNLALINYYFNSKDELISTAVTKIIEDRATTLKDIMQKSIPAKQKLIEFLITMSDIMMEYEEIMKPTVPYMLLEGEIDTPYYVLPIIREYYGNTRTELECRVASYHLMTSFPVAFYRSEDYQKYTGVNIANKEQRDKMIQTIVELFLN